MLYMFYSDSAFSDLNRNLALFDDQVQNFFYNTKHIEDKRSSYLRNSTRLTCAPWNQRAYGRIFLSYDHLETVPDGIKAPLLSTEDKSALAALTASGNEAAKNRFFNIIEFCFLQHSATGTILDKNALDVALQGSSQFTGYITGSLNVSTSTVSAQIRLEDNTNSSTYNFYDWVEFKFMINSFTLSVKIWMNRDIFKAEYPQTVLTKCIYPCNPLDLLNMTFTSTSEAIANAAAFSDAVASAEVTDHDHTGSSIYTTRYVNKTSLASYTMSFAVFYKGGVPSITQLREYVKYSLLNDYPSVTEAEWAAILPDLFVDAGYFIVPYYTMREPITTISTYVDRGYAKHQSFMDKIKVLYPSMTFELIDQKAYLIHIAGSGLEFYVFPSADNSAAHQDFGSELPSYIAVDAQNEAFAYMTEKAKAFAIHSAKVIKLAQGDTSLVSSGEYTKVSIDGKYYYLFVVNSIEYYMLAKESY